MVKDTNSIYFDSAYFVLRSDLPGSAKNSDMLEEAHRMIDSCSAENTTSPKKRQQRMSTSVLIAVTCILAAALIALGVLVIIF